MRRRFILGWASAALLLAACANATQGETARTVTTIAAAETTTTAAEARGEGDETGGQTVGIPSTADRKVIYDGQIRLQAKETREVFDAVTMLVEGSGGFIASTHVGEVSGEDVQPVINFTVRLPADQLTATLSGIRGLADKVVSESLQSQDVTDQFVDIEAQLTNLRALEEELRILLTELRDNNNADPSKLLQVFEQIRVTRGEIESLEGRRQLLSNLVALATLQVSVEPLPAAAPIIPEPEWEPLTVAKAALTDTVKALQAVAEFGIRFLLNILPVLLIIVGPLAVLARLVWKRLRKRPPVMPAAQG
jgi:hypothetical protein